MKSDELATAIETIGRLSDNLVEVVELANALGLLVGMTIGCLRELGYEPDQIAEAAEQLAVTVQANPGVVAKMRDTLAAMPSVPPGATVN